MHRIPFLWRFHQIHHSAEVLTPLTFHRIHPVESLLYDVRGALVTGGMAVSFTGFLEVERLGCCLAYPPWALC